jgi:hypothetical protein
MSHLSHLFVTRFLLTHDDSVLPLFCAGHRVDLSGIMWFGIQLVKHKEELIALPRDEGQAADNTEILGHILDEVLAAVTPQVFEPYWTSSTQSAVSTLLSICIPGNRMKSCGDLLDFISRPRNDSFYSRYLYLYTKIIPDLVKLLGEHNISLSSPTPRKFFSDIIGTYLQDILGSKDGSPFLKFPALTCEHEACSRFNDFLRSEETRITVQLEDPAVEDCIDGPRVFVDKTNRRHGPPASLEYVKKRAAEAAQHWSVRLADTRKMLASIGTDEQISEIMGERYADVEKALEGSQAFVIVGTEGELETEEAMVGVE